MEAMILAALAAALLSATPTAPAPAAAPSPPPAAPGPGQATPPGVALAPDPADGAEPAARLFPVVVGGRWGYVDRRGALVIPARFDRAGPFSEGLAAVQLGARHGWVDGSGALVLAPDVQPAGTIHRPFKDGRAAVRVGLRYGYLDRRGALAIPATLTTAADFSEGLALACTASECGYLDASGRGVLGPGFMGGRPVREGVAVPVLAMSMGRERVDLYEVTGRKLASGLEGAGAMSEGLVAARTRAGWGYLDRSGRGAIQPRFAEAGDFSGGLAPARLPGEPCGYIDRSGAFAIAPRFRACRPFSDGLARVDLAADAEQAEAVAFIDRTGRVVVEGGRAEPPFRDALDFEGGLAAVGVGGSPQMAGQGVQLGYIDTAGRYVWVPRE